MTTPPPNPFGQPPAGQPPQGSPPNGYPAPQPQNGQPAYGYPAPPQQNGQPAYGYPAPPAQNGQPAYGYPAPPQQNGQPAYGYPPAPQPYGQPGYQGQGSVPPQKQGLSWKAKLFFGGGAVAVLGVLGLGAWSFMSGGTTGAHVGNCMQYNPPAVTKVVNCSSAAADAVVIKRFETPIIASCRNVPGTIYSYQGRYRRSGKSHTYLACLGRHTPGQSS
ncbi:hypothetical protein GCM10009760_19200 [Kitasatospora kazusensis]|uniref:Uncharacterized protein n=1 Tax=Kitasatospora kazusensis TaxID=407974 RepID=A0ABP5L2P2_9ACTN